MTSSIITAAMLVLIGLLVLKFPKLIAGYNTMTPEQQKKVDIKRLKTFMCRAFCVMGIAILLVSLLLQPFTSDMIIQPGLRTDPCARNHLYDHQSPALRP